MPQVIARLLTCCEIGLSLAILIAFFYPTPTRDEWVWLIYGYPLVWGVRVWLKQPLGVANAMVLWGGIFIGLCLLNIAISPYPSRGMILLYRPLWGVALMIMMVGWVKRTDSYRPVMWTTGILSAIIAFAALTATTWEGKAARFSTITDILPSTRPFPVWEGGFNPNEIAGAITWLAPLIIAITLRGNLTRLWRWVGLGLAFALCVGLFLGQSLSGMIGVFAGCLVAIVPQKIWRPTVSLILIGILAANAIIFIAPTSSAEFLAEISGRPRITSLEHRGVMWERGVQMLRDHPLTGVGLALYRQLRAEYPTPGFENQLVPHPHNEAMHFATDMGLPGLLVWLMLYANAGLCLFSAWRHDRLRPYAIAIAAGLIAHAVYGLTDAIPVWDRLAFIGWWLFGLCAVLHVKAEQLSASYTPSTD